MKFLTPDEFSKLMDRLNSEAEQQTVGGLLTADDLEQMTRGDALSYALGAVASAHNSLAKGDRDGTRIRQTQAELWLAIANEMPRSVDKQDGIGVIPDAFSSGIAEEPVA